MQLLRDNNINYKSIEYLKDPPSVTALQNICDILNIKPTQLIRAYDKNFKSLEVDLDTLSNSQVFDLIAANPNILERPIIIKKNKGVVGRPPENVLKLI